MPVKEPPYDIGDELDFTVEFRNKNEQLSDPTEYTCTIITPKKEHVDVPLTRQSMGVYSAQYIVAHGSGRYKVVGKGSGVVNVTSAPEIFDVRTEL